MAEPRKPQLRWKRHAPLRGLARICAPPRGWDLRYGDTKVGSVAFGYKKLGSREGGWFYVVSSRSPVPDRKLSHYNSWPRCFDDPAVAKTKCEALVRKQLGMPKKVRS